MVLCEAVCVSIALSVGLVLLHRTLRLQSSLLLSPSLPPFVPYLQQRQIVFRSLLSFYSPALTYIYHTDLCGPLTYMSVCPAVIRLISIHHFIHLSQNLTHSVTLMFVFIVYVFINPVFPSFPGTLLMWQGIKTPGF